MTSFVGTYFTCSAVPGWASAGVDVNGVRWKMTSLSGWDEPPDTRTAFEPRSEADGSHDAPVYDDNRMITFTGVFEAPDRATREATKLTLARLARELKAGATLTGVDEDGAKSVWAKRGPGWKSGGPVGPYGWRYQMQVICPDPYKYGPEQSFVTGLPAAGSGGLVWPKYGSGVKEYGATGATGRVTLSNPGTEDAWPVFQVVGPVLGGLSITDVASGRRIVYADDVPDGATLLIIDSAAGRATLNGADRTGQLTVKQWFPVPPDGTDLSPGIPLRDAYLIDLGNDTATLSSPDLVDSGLGYATVTGGDTVPLEVQFATFGPAGQAGTLTVALRPTYQ